MSGDVKSVALRPKFFAHVRAGGRCAHGGEGWCPKLWAGPYTFRCEVFPEQTLDVNDEGEPMRCEACLEAEES